MYTPEASPEILNLVKGSIHLFVFENYSQHCSVMIFFLLIQYWSSLFVEFFLATVCFRKVETSNYFTCPSWRKKIQPNSTSVLENVDASGGIEKQVFLFSLFFIYLFFFLPTSILPVLIFLPDENEKCSKWNSFFKNGRQVDLLPLKWRKKKLKKKVRINEISPSEISRMDAECWTI